MKIKLIEAKCVGAIKGLESLSNNYDQYVLSDDFGRDYNSLRIAVINSVPDSEPHVPPEVGFGEQYAGAHRRTMTSPAELYGFLNQLREILAVSIRD